MKTMGHQTTEEVVQKMIKVIFRESGTYWAFFVSLYTITHRLQTRMEVALLSLKSS